MYWRRYKKNYTQDNNTSVTFKVGTLGPHTVLPVTISCPVIFFWISSTAWNLFPFKNDFSFGKSQSCMVSDLGCGELSHLGDVMFCLEAAWDVRHERVLCHGAVAHRCGLLNHRTVSVEECSSFMQILIEIYYCSTLSFILDATAIRYTCSLNDIDCPHWLAQWSHHCSLMHIPVHSPWLPGYTDVTQTLTVVGLSWIELVYLEIFQQMMTKRLWQVDKGMWLD